MRSKILFSFLFPIIFIGVCGCAPLIIGAAAGALGGYAISKDTVQGETDKPYDLLWNSAIMISKVRGTVVQEDSIKGYIEFKSSSSHVWIRLARLTLATTRLKVSCRKNHFPNLALAQDLFVKILEGAQ